MNYFAYGSNLNKRQMLERCPGSKTKFPATLPNYKLLFTGYSRFWKGGSASIKPFKGEKVLGAIYELTELDLRKLDKYEDYPGTYNRFNITAWTENGDAIESITYIKKEQATETKPSLEYLNTIRQGYKDWQIE